MKVYVGVTTHQYCNQQQNCDQISVSDVCDLISHGGIVVLLQELNQQLMIKFENIALKQQKLQTSNTRPNYYVIFFGLKFKACVFCL